MSSSTQSRSSESSAEIRRRKKSESARRCRERQRCEEEQMRKVFKINEERIKELEATAESLKAELRDQKPLRPDRHVKTAEKPPEAGDSTNKVTFRKQSENRPEWFGVPF